MSTNNPEVPDRQKTHGSYYEQSQCANAITKTLYDFGLNRLDASQHHALIMISTKLSRILVGDADFKDHWADIAGYCERVIEGISESK
jgi:hypothetical protein